MDNIVTLNGVILSYVGIFIYFPCLFLLGCIFSKIESYVRNNNIVSVIINIYMITCIIYFERGIEVYVITARNFIAFLIIYFLIIKLIQVYTLFIKYVNLIIN